MDGTVQPDQREESGEQELRRLFDLAYDLLCVANVEGFFTRVNPAFERVLGYSDEELLSQSFLEFVHPDDRQRTLDVIDKIAGGEAAIDFENRYRAKDGTYRWLAWRSTPAQAGGKIYAIARDVTEMKRAEARLEERTDELRRSNEELERFAYIVSHDLQAPLRAVRNLATWLAEDLGSELSAEHREHLDELRGRVDRMEMLIHDLLDYSRVGHQVALPEPIDTGALVAEIMDLLAPSGEFVLEVDEEMPVLVTGRAPLAQVFRNLISNAIQHHDRDRGSVRVDARPRDDLWEFRVHDDGPGIPEELADDLFTLFERGAGDDAAGIGLDIVRRAVEAHGGEVWIEADAGRGATVCFTWPDQRTDA